jgi:hypothetical protein
MKQEDSSTVTGPVIERSNAKAKKGITDYKSTACVNLAIAVFADIVPINKKKALKLWAQEMLRYAQIEEIRNAKTQ